MNKQTGSPLDINCPERNKNVPVVEKSEVIRARQIQEVRFRESNGIYCNTQMTSRQLRTICRIDQTGHTLLKNAMEKLNLSARGYDRILKVSWTIADLDSSEGIKPEHLSEAIQYRSLDRENCAG